MKPWYQYEASLFSGVGDIGVDWNTGELIKFGPWPPSWILPNSAHIRTRAVFYIRKAIYTIWKWSEKNWASKCLETIFHEMDGSHLGFFQIRSISKTVLENLNTKFWNQFEANPFNRCGDIAAASWMTDGRKDWQRAFHSPPPQQSWAGDN